MQILRIHTAQMQENGMLASDFDINELAASTKNFTGAEIERLVRAATNNAMYPFIKVLSEWKQFIRVVHC